MRDWSKIAKDTVFTGTDEDGNRYLSEFLRDYKKTFDPAIIEAGCRRCLNDYYLKLTSTLHKMEKVKNSGYRLKAKYNGIPLTFGSQIQVFNSNLTDDLAKELIKRHPAGLELFDQLPAEGKAQDDETGSGQSQDPAKDTAPAITVNSLVKDNTRDQLNAKAFELGLEGESFEKKADVAEAIVKALAEVKE